MDAHSVHIRAIYPTLVRLPVVEDDQLTADMLRRGLTEDGYLVEVFGRGPEALWHATLVDHEAVITDLMLPGMDGLETCR